MKSGRNAPSIYRHGLRLLPLLPVHAGTFQWLEEPGGASHGRRLREGGGEPPRPRAMESVACYKSAEVACLAPHREHSIVGVFQVLDIGHLGFPVVQREGP